MLDGDTMFAFGKPRKHIKKVWVDRQESRRFSGCAFELVPAGGSVDLHGRRVDIDDFYRIDDLEQDIRMLAKIIAKIFDALTL